jgi:antitoxin component YwqK of YwqJK toxin-antitoxin module
MFSCTQNSGEQIQETTFSIKNLQDSILCSDVQGLKLKEGDIVPIDYNGIIYRCYDNGLLMNISEVVNGKQEGVAKSFYESGELLVVANWSKGITQGEVKSYFKNGQLEIEQEFDNGKKIGKQVKYYENGKIESSCFFEKGVMQGEYKTYYENGNPKFFTVMKDGSPIQAKNEIFENVESVENNDVAPIFISGLNFEIYPITLMRGNVERHTAWYFAKEECNKLGNGWRLPTLLELRQMYEHKDEIGGFKHFGNAYWSSTPVESVNGYYYTVDFDDGFEMKSGTNQPVCIRPVRKRN